MGKLISLIFWLAFIVAANAQQSVKVSALPPATTPFTGSEIFYVIQGNISSRVDFATLAQQVGSSPVGSNAALTAINTTGLISGTVFVTRQGFYALGDSPAVTYVWSSSSCTVNAGAGDNGSQVRPFAGGGCWIADLTSPLINSTAIYGSKCDGATDDTAALQNAGNTAVRLNIPMFVAESVNGCAVFQNGANAYSLLFTGPIDIEGAPGRSIILPAAGLSPSVSIIYLTGTAFDYKPTIINGIMIGNPSAGTRTGLHAIVFDTTAASSRFLRPQIRNNYLQQDASGLGYSVYAVNNASNNINGGFAYADFVDNFIGSGVSLNSSGDSIAFRHNAFSSTSSNPGIYANLIAFAGNLSVSGGNNFGTSEGSIVIDCAVSVQIRDNEIEQDATNTEVNNAMVDMTGSVCTIPGVMIEHNQIQALTGMGNPTYIRLGATTNAQVTGNDLTLPASYVPVAITGSASDTLIGAGNTFTGGSALVTDSGVRTIYGSVVREVASNVGPAAIVSATPTNVGPGVLLSQGYWTCTGYLSTNVTGSTVTPQAVLGLNTVTGTLPGVGSTAVESIVNQPGTTGLVTTVNVGPANYAVAAGATPTLFMVADVTYSAGTLTVNGGEQCQRLY